MKPQVAQRLKVISPVLRVKKRNPNHPASRKAAWAATSKMKKRVAKGLFDWRKGGRGLAGRGSASNVSNNKGTRRCLSTAVRSLGMLRTRVKKATSQGRKYSSVKRFMGVKILKENPRHSRAAE